MFAQLSQITNNLDNKRIPLNSAERAKLSQAKRYPYIGANNVLEYIDEYIFDEKILCIAEDGGSWGANQVCAKIYKEKCWVNNHAHVLTAKPGTILEYLAAYLNYSNLNAYITGTTRGKLTRSKLDSIAIYLPPLNDQIRIAHLLGKVEDLIASRKQHLQQLDDLLKSVFLEMFGDPVRNEKGWTINSLANLGRFKNGMNFGKGESGNMVKCLGVGDFKSRSKIINTESLSLIKLNTMPSEDYFLKNGDLIFVRSNGNRDLVGRCIAVYPNEQKITYSGFCIRLRITEKDIINETYLAHLFRSSSFRKLMLTGGQGANIQNINQQTLSDLPIAVPPPELQKQFVDFIEKVEALNFLYQQSLTKLESLYGVLSQQAFKGELDLSRVPLPAKSAAVEIAKVINHVEFKAEVITFHLPETDLLLPALEDRKLVKNLLCHWLQSYCAQLGNRVFSIEIFMRAVQNRIAEVHPDNDFELSSKEYEYVKDWVFEALAQGRLQQVINITKDSGPDGKPVYGNLIEIKTGVCT